MDWYSLIPVVTFVLGLLVKVVYDVWRDRYLEKRGSQTKGLTLHYSELNKIISKIEIQLNGTSNDWGLLYTTIDKGDEDIEHMPTEYFSWPFFKGGDEPELKSHFPREAEDCDKLLDLIQKHNDGVYEFDKKLLKTLNQVFEIDKSNSELGVEDASAIREIICQFVKEKLGMTKKNPMLLSPISNHTLKYTENPNGSFSITIYNICLVNLSDKSTLTKYIKSFSEILDSKSIFEDIKTIFLDAKDIDAKVTNIASRFTAIRRQYSEFGKKLMRKRDCPTCRLIFG
jgi:hypothetical protein